MNEQHDPSRTALAPDPASASTAPSSANSPTTFGRYRVERLLGKGGFGEVYLGHDDELDRAVAIKVPRRELLARKEDVDSYLAEARILARLDHPNIVPVFDVGRTDDGSCFIVSKFIEGSDLAQKMRQERFPALAVVEIMATVAEALQYAHRQGLVHRDIKPGNILLDKSRKSFVGDFGLALREQDFGKGPRFPGTPAYMSPEQARGEGHRVDGRSDIFSLGVVFYEFLTGKRPFNGESTAEVLAQVTTLEPRPARQWDDAIPKELERICLKALSKRASDRYSAARDMADDLRHWSSTACRPGEASALPELAAPGVGKDVFISYASPDKEAAFQICRLLEEKDVKCWIAPRDVTPGADYAEAIVKAIGGTSATVLLLSVHANASIHVTHEVERATSRRKRVIPVCLQNVPPGPSLELHLASAHRLDAWHISPEQVAAQLVIALRGDSNTPSPANTPTDLRPLKIVPKGLRSFDAHDADFFLELLPGPRDRDGLPDSLRFWKTRIEETDSDHAFTVGLIYGPSGCGKSSLVKAGLLPHLSGAVIAVYVEATAEETETRLLNGLRKSCPSLPKELGLKETLAALRRGREIPQGKKVLFVLDQFEQWLHTKKNEENTELVQALRQCDGSRVQCLIMVRDDFWLAVSRFVRDLEVDLVPDRNIALVDIFDVDHARKVLMAFGRAFGKIPETDVTQEQNEFLNNAVSGLAQENKVICVRLALFAEMMKGRPWTLAALKEVGGTEGVGITFLEDTFSSPSANPKHRLHQKAARAVLKALLPKSGTQIKGTMRSSSELLEASGYAGRPREFDDLIRILDSEIRLITPTDPEGKDSAEDSASLAQPGQKYYQLTHDYLVHSLREWLTRKQKETRRGRAELLLADRASVWNARPENRQMPSLSQWVRIRSLTQKKNWTPPQKKMMRQAGRYHAVRGFVVAVFLAMGTFTGLTIRERAEERHKATEAAGQVEALVNADTAQVPEIIAKMAKYREWVDPLLRDAYDKATAKSTQKLHASLALLPVDATQIDFLYHRLLDADPDEVPVVRDALAPYKDELTNKLWAVVETPQRGKQAQRLRAAAALAKYDPQNKKWATANTLVVHDLVRENAIFLGQWTEAFKFVKGHLVSPLSVIYRDHHPERAAERTLATNLLSDYAADRPQVLADLLMDAEEKQFAAIFPKFKQHGNQGLSVLTGEIEKKRVIVQDKIVFEKEGTIAEDDSKVKTKNGLKPSQQFEIPLHAGRSYRIKMDSKDLDSFLVLQDKSGTELASGNDSGGGLNASLVFTAPSDGTFVVFAASLKKTGSFVLKIADLNIADRIAADAGKENLSKRQANAAVALLKMNQPEKVWPLLKHSPDPRVRSYLIHRFQPLGADPKLIFQQYQQEKDISIQRALLLSLGDFEKELSLTKREKLMAELLETYRNDPDPGLHGAAEWLLRQWKQDDKFKKIDENLATGKVEGKRQWYVNKQGQTFAVISPKEFWMGSPPEEVGRFGGPDGQSEMKHWCKIGRSFAVATKEVTVAQFRRCPAFKEFAYNKVFAPTFDHPINRMIWYEAAEYCNWLSKEEFLDECYEPNGEGKYAEGMKMKANYLQLNGYRLPTEAEWEYACRAEAETSRFYGETQELLGKYAWYTKNSQDRWLLPMENLKGDEPNLQPNDFGLFHMLGNTLEWCQDDAGFYSSGTPDKPNTDKEDINDIKDGIFDKRHRVLRGGSFVIRSSYVRSAVRDDDVPSYRHYNVGFRVARTISP